jgi:hypothetical protein
MRVLVFSSSSSQRAVGGPRSFGLAELVEEFRRRGVVPVRVSMGHTATGEGGRRSRRTPPPGRRVRPPLNVLPAGRGMHRDPVGAVRVSRGRRVRVASLIGAVSAARLVVTGAADRAMDPARALGHVRPQAGRPLIVAMDAEPVEIAEATRVAARRGPSVLLVFDGARGAPSAPGGTWSRLGDRPLIVHCPRPGVGAALVELLSSEGEWWGRGRAVWASQR